MALMTGRTAYDDPTSPAQLHDDCRLADAALTGLTSVAHRAQRPAPSIRFQDYDGGMPPKDIDMLVAAQRLADKLGLNLD